MYINPEIIGKFQSDMKKRCSKCNNNFDCKENETCWCHDLKNQGIVMNSENLGDDCLCERCLKSLAMGNDAESS